MPFSDLPKRLAEVRERIRVAAERGGRGQTVTVIAVTKSHGPDAFNAALDAGIMDIGENRVQEALSKMDVVSRPARWHLIGHLQRNKVHALPRFHLTHSLDRASLADAADAMARSAATTFDVLVQVNPVREETKGGYTMDELPLEAARLRRLSGLRVRGVMTIAPLAADASTLRTVFASARQAREILSGAGHEATELSMGMSNDFEIAVEEGATCVRLGTVLFGARAA
jgi:PLP dependent protein